MGADSRKWWPQFGRALTEPDEISFNAGTQEKSMNSLENLARLQKNGQPVVPGLLRSCGRCKGLGRLRHLSNDKDAPCYSCGGTGSVAVNKNKALVVMLNWAIANGYCVSSYPILKHADAPYTEIINREAECFRAKGTGVQALAAAILQAQEVKI